MTFLDTPGHEAFSAMRARGSQVTDVIVLVVAADSMVMPQTVESIELAKREKVPMVVAITKIDLPTANPDKIRAQLAERGVEVEQWGGSTSCIEVSARTGQGMNDLLETLALEAEVLELKANPDAHARGAVVESKLDVGKGSMATILVQNGTLHVGDPFVCGIYAGRVRAMFNERGEQMKEAPPSAPCQVLGFDGTPQAGDDLIVVEDEKTAREIASKRRMAARERDLRARKTVSLENSFNEKKEGKLSELNLIVKADVGGSAEALAASLEKLTNKEVRVNIIRKGGYHYGIRYPLGDDRFCNHYFLPLDAVALYPRNGREGRYRNPQLPRDLRLYRRYHERGGRPPQADAARGTLRRSRNPPGVQDSEGRSHRWLYGYRRRSRPYEPCARVPQRRGTRYDRGPVLEAHEGRRQVCRSWL